jgi:hypothetical protein
MSGGPLTVSALIERLADFDRKEVSVRGVLAIQRENNSLADSAREEDPRRRLWVRFHHATLGTRERDIPSYDGRTVVATGILTRERKGHLSVFAASLTIRQLACA